MSKPKKTYDKKIVIRGIEYDRDYFKPYAFDEGGLPGILEALDEIGDMAREGGFSDDYLYNNSPLQYIEGLLRYQIMRVEEDLRLTLKELETTSDFLHEKHYVHNYVSSSKAVFLFDFLSDIVFISHRPEQIDKAALEKIALNLRALSFLVEPEVNGSIKNENIAFEIFAKAVWRKMGEKKITAQQFWDYAISTLDNDKNAGEVTFDIKRPSWEGDKTDTYAIRLEINKSGKQVIKTICESKDIPDGRPKGLGQINNIWVNLQDKFIKETKPIKKLNQIRPNLKKLC